MNLPEFAHYFVSKRQMIFAKFLYHLNQSSLGGGFKYFLFFPGNYPI